VCDRFRTGASLVSRLELARRAAGLALAVVAVASQASEDDSGLRIAQAGSGAGRMPAAEFAKSKCAPCHGVDGNSVAPTFPKLAGQNPDYLYRQLWAFKTGARPSQVMSVNALPLSDAEITDLAGYFSAQPIRPDRQGDPRLASLGERIFYAPRVAGPGGMPCASCHAGAYGSPMMRGGPTMGMMGRGPMGMMGGGVVPRLNGQHAPYLVDQLNRFAAGARQGGPMGWIAAQLDPHEREAVAAYLSALP
jgi:cytochrome c553